MEVAYFSLLARYANWANDRLFAACARLAPEDYHKRRPSFFGSIHRTLNHLLVTDRIWLSRITGVGHDIPSLDHVLCETFESLRDARLAEDARLAQIVDGLDANRLDHALAFRSMDGTPREMPLRLVLGHLFNHHAHHRGQIHDMLSQTPVEPPALDLTYFST